MQLHIGTKQVTAKPMTRQAYNDYRGWTLPADEDGTDEGYLVEDMTTKHVNWQPAAVFTASHRPTTGMTFGLAIEALKAGKRVARAGWNGKGMWLSLSCDGTREVPAENFWSPHNAEHARQSGGKATVLPSITMKTATGEILMGWLASQTDMLAEDWQIVS